MKAIFTKYSSNSSSTESKALENILTVFVGKINLYYNNAVYLNY